MIVFRTTIMLLLIGGCAGLPCCHYRATNAKQKGNPIIKLEMHLSAFGVESDGFPWVDADIDFIKKQAICHRWYDNPAFKDSTYSLSPLEMDTLYKLLAQIDLTKLKRSYERLATDQPTSTTLVIQPNKDTVTIKDYGLIGDGPLPEMYKIVYKWVHPKFSLYSCSSLFSAAL
jgi:hypothetical protein